MSKEKKTEGETKANSKGTKQDDQLESQVAEVSKTIKDAVMADIKEELSELNESKKSGDGEKSEEGRKAHIRSVASEDFLKMDDAQPKQDMAQSKAFSDEAIKRYSGPQKAQEDIDAKNMIFWKALYQRAIEPYESRYHKVVKALSEGTDADGGYLVTPEFRTEVLRQLHHNGILRPEVRVMPTNTDSVKFNAEDGRPQVSWGSENTEIATTTAGLSQTTINVHRLNSRMHLSREVVADSDPSILQWIQDEFRDSVLNEEDRVLARGSGSGQPKGLTNITGFKSHANTGSLTFDDFVDLEHTLSIQYRQQNAKWFMNDVLLRDLQKLQDADNAPIYHRALDRSRPDMLLGYPIVVSNEIPQKEIYFGNLRDTYIMLDRQQMSVETTREGAGTFEKHQVAVKITMRIGGDVVRKERLVKGTNFSA